MKSVALPVEQRPELPAPSLAALQNQSQAFSPPELLRQQQVFFPTERPE
jgi:hypothetical protein